MKAFTYERAQSPAEAAAAAARIAGAKFIAGGTNLLDLMKLEIETPAHLIDVNRLELDKIEATPEGGLRIGALVRNTDLAADRAGAPRLRPALARAPCRRFRPTAQQGNDRRQSVAADALPVFLRHQSAVQQTQSRQRLRRNRRVQPAARRARCQRKLHCHPLHHERRPPDGHAHGVRLVRSLRHARRHGPRRPAGLHGPGQPQRHRRPFLRRARPDLAEAPRHRAR